MELYKALETIKNEDKEVINALSKNIGSEKEG